jgi:DegV family protein with EDD domain
MPRVRVVTDSAADIPAELVRAHSILVVPLTVHFGDKTYVEGEDIDPPAFYEMLGSNPNHPRTSQPSIGRFEQAYRRLEQEHAEVVSIHLSSGLSGTFGSAQAAAQSIAGLKIHIVDSQLASMAEGAVVLAAAQRAEAGESAEAIVQFAEAMRSRVHVAIMIDNLAFLQRGGRIGRAQSMLGTLLSVKPIVTLEGGLVLPMQRSRTTSRALLDMAAVARSLAPLESVRILHSSTPDIVAEFSRLLEPIFGQEVPSQLLGPVVGSHVVKGVVAVLMIRPEPS